MVKIAPFRAARPDTSRRSPLWCKQSKARLVRRAYTVVYFLLLVFLVRLCFFVFLFFVSSRFFRRERLDATWMKNANVGGVSEAFKIPVREDAPSSILGASKTYFRSVACHFFYNMVDAHRIRDEYIMVDTHLFDNMVVVVLTLTHRQNTMQSVVAGQAPITLEWNN